MRFDGTDEDGVRWVRLVKKLGSRDGSEALALALELGYFTWSAFVSCIPPAQDPRGVEAGKFITVGERVPGITVPKPGPRAA